MKLKQILPTLVAAAIIGLPGFSQKPTDDSEKAKGKSEAMKNQEEQKLTGKGRAEYVKAQNDLKKVSDASFAISPNADVNNVEDKSKLLGLAGSTPDESEANKQNDENKKKESEVSSKLQSDRKVSGASFDAGGKAGKKEPSSTTTGVGASWTDAGYWATYLATPVKNQGGCGSCWAFAACATFEHTYKLFYGGTVDLSEQSVLACGTTNCGSQDAGSCGGGWSDRAMSWMTCRGVSSEGSYPYTATSLPCNSSSVYKRGYTWGSCYTNATYRIEWIKYYLTIYGAVTTYMKAGISTFYSYSGGVYNGWPNSWGGGIDHAVTIVGWYNPYNAFLIKNSWGTGWGFGGYAWVRWDNCNIGNYNYYIHPNA
jgi:C1A family cysteine protease